MNIIMVEEIRIGMLGRVSAQAPETVFLSLFNTKCNSSRFRGVAVHTIAKVACR